MGTTTNTTQIATTRISPITALVATVPVRVCAPAVGCSPWERSHASTPVVSTGGVRLLPVGDGRLRDAMGAYGASLFPSAGPSTSSPPV
ncbi:hypothetical protein AB2L28_08090 [Kineococcus sp. TBRC 1896]|uniref:Uncharacterized protein n=1 Tax=Kineococcus mangrovi TaxID=1660183 RepID=A0ABV4I0K2_9ACTN